MTRAARLVILYGLETLAVLLALLIFVAAGVLWRLAEGPIEAEIVRGLATEMLAEAVDASDVSIGQVLLSYDPEFAGLVIEVVDVKAYNDDKILVLDADQVKTALALDLLILGRAAPQSVTLSGGKVLILRDSKGQFFTSLGDTHSVDRRTENGSGRPNNLSQSGDKSALIVSRLRQIDLHNVDLRYIDEGLDVDWPFQDVKAHVEILDNAIETDISANLITSAGLASVALRLISGRRLEQFFIDLSVDDLVPAASAPRRGSLSSLNYIDAPLDLELVIDASRSGGLKTVVLEVEAKPGLVRLDEIEYSVRPSNVSILLDTQNAIAEIRSVKIDTDLLNLDLTGKVFDFSNYNNSLPSFFHFELETGAGFVNLGDVFPEPPKWESVLLNGHLNISDKSIHFDRLDLQLSEILFELSGQVFFTDIEGNWRPNIQLKGPIKGQIKKQDILALWPLEFATGARDWVRDSIMDGIISNSILHVDIPAKAIADGALKNDHLQLDFEFSNADVRYMQTMTPLMGVSGSAILRGDSLSLSGQGGQIGNLVNETIYVEIPRFNPKGAIARFGGTGVGQVRDFLSLVDEPPLEVAIDNGLDIDEFDGNGQINFEIRRPMRRTVPAERIDYDVSGVFESVRAPLGFNNASLTDGVVDIAVNRSGFTANAKGQLVGASARLVWKEKFGLGDAELSTSVDFEAIMSVSDLDRLGLPLRRYFDGNVDVLARVAGRGMDYSNIDLSLDLKNTTVSLPADIWDKPDGEPASARLISNFDTETGLKLDRVELQGEGIKIDLSAELAADGRLVRADITQLDVAGRMNLTAKAERPDGIDGVLALNIDARYLDLADTVSLAGSSGSGFNFVTAPIEVEAIFDRVRVRGVEFKDIDLSASAGPEGLIEADFIAETETGSVALQFGADPALGDGTKRLVLGSEDAGSLLSAFVGYNNVDGGQLYLEGLVPVYGSDKPATGSLNVDTFTLQQMPVLARILAAGSFEGLAGLLSGEEGMQFERLESTYSWDDGILQMDESRVAGPSLGVTWAGEIDFNQNAIDISGSLLPSYGVNSALGGIPVLGGLLTSRRGEGVFGMTYSVEGPFDETRVTVNPLSALAPGVLRRIFEGTSGDTQFDAVQPAEGPSQENQTEDKDMPEPQR